MKLNLVSMVHSHLLNILFSENWLLACRRNYSSQCLDSRVDFNSLTLFGKNSKKKDTLNSKPVGPETAKSRP